MTNSIFTQFIQRSSLGYLGQRLPHLAASLAWATAVSLGIGAAVQAEPGVIGEGADLSLAQAPASFPADGPGQYLFGQTPEPDQVGQGYMVLDNTGDRVYGALYFPSSSFDCFHGQVQGNQLAMTIINSYTQEAYPYSVALVTDTAIASSDSGNTIDPLGLDGFYQLDGPSDNDLRILEMCRGVVDGN
jgi:hypothetical protein